MTDSPIGPAAFEDLFRLQERDSEIDRFEHRRANLAGHAAIADVQRRAGVLRPDLAAATARRDEVAARQLAIEAEVESLDQRIAEINSRLFGSVPISPKDAQAMSEEVKHLTQRRSGMEDDELELMEAVEPLQAEVDRLEGDAHQLSKELQEAQKEVAAAQADIDSELQAVRTIRAAVAGEVPASLLTEYNRLRSSLGGVAVARLAGNACGGCHLTIAASELDRLRKAPDDQVLHCEECGRILVRSS